MKKKFALPDAYVILFIILALAAVLTWVVPAGEYERQETDSATIVVPGSYSQIDSSSAGLLDVCLAIQEGMVAAAPLIFLVLIIGGIVRGHRIDRRN